MAEVKCKDCNFKSFMPRKCGPSRYYCEHPDARFARSKCEPTPLICRTDRGSNEITIKTSPKWCPLRKNKENDGDKSKMAYKAEFKSIREIDLTKLERPQVAVYDDPKDYPKKAVARVMDNGKDTNMVIIADRVSDLHTDVRRYTNLVWGFRGTADEPELVGVFF